MEKILQHLQKEVDSEVQKRDKAIANINGLLKEIDDTKKAAEALTGGMDISKALHPEPEEEGLQFQEGSASHIDEEAVPDMTPITQNDFLEFP